MRAIVWKFRNWQTGGTSDVVMDMEENQLVEGLNVMVSGGGLKSTVLRRGWEIARGRLSGPLQSLTDMYQVATLGKCLVCGDAHSTLRCFELLERALDREDSYFNVIETRIALGATQAEKAEDMMRLASSQRRKSLLQRRRYIGLIRLSYSLLRIGVVPATLGVLRPILSNAALADDVYYLLTGRRFAFARWRVQNVLNAMFAAKGLLDFYEQEQIRLAAEKVEPVGHRRVIEYPELILFGDDPSPNDIAGPSVLPTHEEVKAVVTELEVERRVEPAMTPEREFDIVRRHARGHPDPWSLWETDLQQLDNPSPAYQPVQTTIDPGYCVECRRFMYKPPRPWFWRSCPGCDGRRPRNAGGKLI